MIMQVILKMAPDLTVINYNNLSWEKWHFICQFHGWHLYYLFIKTIEIKIMQVILKMAAYLMVINNINLSLEKWHLICQFHGWHPYFLFYQRKVIGGDLGISLVWITAYHGKCQIKNEEENLCPYLNLFRTTFDLDSCWHTTLTLARVIRNV